MACYFKNSNPSTLCCDNTSAKVCIDTNRVFDACISRRSESMTFTVDFGGETAVSIASVSSTGVSSLTSLTVTPIPSSENSRVQYTVNVPLTVVGLNGAGTTVTGTASVNIDQDIVLRVPQNGMIIPEIQVTVMINGLQSTVINGNVVTTNACITIITKVVADVILVVPTNGYLTLPPCQQYTQDVCSSVFSTPVFPR